MLVLMGDQTSGIMHTTRNATSLINVELNLSRPHIKDVPHLLFFFLKIIFTAASICENLVSSERRSGTAYHEMFEELDQLKFSFVNTSLDSCYIQFIIGYKL